MTSPFVPGPPLRIAGAPGGPLAGLTFAAKDLQYYSLASDADPLGQDPLTVVEAPILRPDARLRDEGRSLLIEEFAPEHTTAFSILRAIAAGRVQLQEMSAVTGIPPTALPKDLRRLQDDFQLVERELPLGDAAGRLGRHDRVLALIRRDLPTLEGRTYETLMHRGTREGDERLRLAFEPDAVGRWWNPQGVEIDVVARSGKGTEAFFGEWHLSAGKVDRALLHGPRQKAAQVPWARALKKAHHGLFSIGRASPTIRAEAKALAITLWEL